jgi:hypothetical protein
MIREPFGSVLLALGAGAGLLLATAGIVQSKPAVPEGAVAVVNGHPIPESEYRRALSALRAERPGVSEAELEKHVLDRLIDEQLLIDSALELGLADRDPKVRADLGTAAIGAIVDGAEEQPSETELRQFYEKNRDYFRSAPRLHARRWVFVAGAETKIEGAAPDPTLPDAPLSPAKLEQYLGRSQTRVLLALEPGSVSEPLDTPGGVVRLRLLSKEPGKIPSFEAAREQVRVELQRRAGEERLRRFFAERRERAHIVEVQR